jgi:hypothetical protein
MRTTAPRSKTTCEAIRFPSARTPACLQKAEPEFYDQERHVAIYPGAEPQAGDHVTEGTIFGDAYRPYVREHDILQAMLMVFRRHYTNSIG